MQRAFSDNFIHNYGRICSNNMGKFNDQYMS